MNFESGSQLRLDMLYHVSGSNADVSVACMDDAQDVQTYVGGLLAESLIRNTDCVDASGGV